MATCPNKNLDSWKNLVSARGENIAYALWDMYGGNVPESESRESIVKAGLKAINALQTDKAVTLFSILDRNKVKGDAFWNKIQSDLQIPKEQIELLKQYNTTNREELVTNMLADYSYAIEINLSKIEESNTYIKALGSRVSSLTQERGRYYFTDERDVKIEIDKESWEDAKKEFDSTDKTERSTTYYSNLTVPGGTNYTENEIATPAITPSIKGHAQFATDKGIGWFRSDEQISKYEDKFAWAIEQETGEKSGSKTRRILEVQSDLFQKGRDSKVLSKKLDIKKVGDTFISNGEKFTVTNIDTDSNLYELITISNSEGKTATLRRSELEKRFDARGDISSENQFLQLLNQGSNWVTFFVKSIIQDSAKKGYEKVLFPSGNTASKVEGHTTLEEFKKQKEDRIKQLEEVKERTIRSEKSIVSPFLQPGSFEKEIERIDNEITQLKQELERIDREGFGALRPIYNFYENTVANVLKKQGYSPKQVTDEYGNTWNEVEIAPERKQETILFQTEELPSSTASPELISKAKELLKKMGVDMTSLADYVKEAKLDIKGGVNGIADLVRGVIAIAEGKEDVALLEEMVHIATAILEQKNPRLITEMISKIDRFKIYNQVYEQYKKIYTLPNGKPDIRKIKKEAVDKLIVEVVVNNNANIEQYPELREEVNQSFVRKIWNTILDFFRGEYKKANISIFEEVGERLVSGEIEGVVSDIKGEGVYFQITDAQQKVLNLLENTKNSINKVVEQKKETDPLLSDTEEADNFYERKTVAGEIKRIKHRVTDRVKQWYRDKFGYKPKFTKQEQQFNELKRKYGLQGHADFEEIHSRFHNPDGTRKTSPDPRPPKFNLPDEDMYDKLERYYVELINSFEPGTIFLSEKIIYDEKNDEAGTIDFLAIEPSGKAHIMDWKFMHIKGDDVAWFKQGAFNVQIERYKDILRSNYGIKEFGLSRAIPISMKFSPKNVKNLDEGFNLTGIAIGSVNPELIEDIRLLPVASQSEATMYPALDKLLVKLNKLLEQIGKEKVTDEQSKEFKIERLNVLRLAIRKAQILQDVSPLIKVIELMRIEGNNLVNDYEAIYKNIPSTRNDFKNKDLSDFADKMNNFLSSSEIFVNVGRELSKIIDVGEADVLASLTSASNDIYDSQLKIKEAAQEFADKHIGERNLVFGLLNPEPILQGLGSMFRGASELGLKSVELLTKLTNDAQLRGATDAFEEIKSLMSIRERLAKRGNLLELSRKVYQKTEKGERSNKLVYKHKKEFNAAVDKNAADGGDMNWIKENIDVEAYKKEAQKELQKRNDDILSRVYSPSEAENEDIRRRKIEANERMFNIENKNFDGWDNYIIKRHPLSKWYSEEYKEIERDKDLLDLYNFIQKYNEKAARTGYITNSIAKNFIPFVRKSMAEEIAWNGNISAVFKWNEKLRLQPDDVGYGQFNELNGELENTIPRYYTQDFTYKDGVNDYSEVSEDIFKNMILYIQQVEKYKYLLEVEGQLKLLKTIETFKGHLLTDNVNNVVREGGNPKVIESNVENTKTYDDFMRVILYDQKNVLSSKDIPLGVGKVLTAVKNDINRITGRKIFKDDENPSPTSLYKTIDTINRGFQLKTLGLDFVSGMANWFGNNIQMLAQVGDYFKGKEFARNQWKIMKQLSDSKSEQEMFTQLINTFMPLKDDPSKELYESAGIKVLTRGNFSDFLYIFMREPEVMIEKTIFLTLLDNTMIENGKVVNIRKFVKNKYKSRYDSSAKYHELKDKIEQEIETLKKTRSISVIKKLENGKLVIPGLDLTNRDEIQRLTNLSRNITSNITGTLTKQQINKMSMNIWTRSMMVFKGWIPKLAETRFGELRRVSDDFSVRLNENDMIEGQKYDIGRLRLLGHVLSSGIFQGVSNLRNIINLNDDGLKTLDEMFEHFKNRYKDQTGEELNMDRDEFIDLIRNNLRNQIRELVILGSLFGVLLSMGFMAPDDEEDKATKNLHRYARRVVDKFVSELSFFYNPTEMKDVLSGGVFPALGLADDFFRFVKHFFMETTGMDFDPKTSFDETRKKAQPIKNMMKMAPVTKSLVTYLAIFNEEFAKEFDVTIQAESKR